MLLFLYLCQFSDFCFSFILFVSDLVHAIDRCSMKISVMMKFVVWS